MLSVTDGLIMPTFTYKTMVIPANGPPDNAITYGKYADANLMAEFYSSDMPADPMMGIIPETLRLQPEAKRSDHPIYSFSGVAADEALSAQNRADPFAPIRVLTDSQGVVLLLGVNHTANTSIHYGEQLAGRKQFIRWALTPKGIVECPGWPGCSYGFEAIAPEIANYSNGAQVGDAVVQLIPLSMLTRTVVDLIKNDPLALLCSRPSCERCQEVYRHVNVTT
jgi:aminoglycoside 3-N-acetyltransferase